MHEWENGLCSCFSAGSTCCLGWCCPCFSYGRVNYRINHPEDPNLDQFSMVNARCGIFCLAIYFTGIGPCILQCLQRTEVREAAGIRGDSFKDCLVAWCCHCCSLIQDEQETKALRERTGIYAANQPAAQPGMTYQPQP